MKFYRCKCGDSTVYGSLSPNPCDRCSKCGSDLARGPESHCEPRPHSLAVSRTEVLTDSGPVGGEITQCVWCLKTLAEITKRGEQHEKRP